MYSHTLKILCVVAAVAILMGLIIATVTAPGADTSFTRLTALIERYAELLDALPPVDETVAAIRDLVGAIKDFAPRPRRRTATR